MLSPAYLKYRMRSPGLTCGQRYMQCTDAGSQAHGQDKLLLAILAEGIHELPSSQLQPEAMCVVREQTKLASG
jgi:hypothetical protein